MRPGVFSICREDCIVVFFLLFFIAAWLFFFPGFYSAVDEHSYLKNAMQLQRGPLGEENPEYAAKSNAFSGGRYTASQFIGRSLFLIPFTWFGLGGAMLSGLVIHLISFALVLLVLQAGLRGLAPHGRGAAHPRRRQGSQAARLRAYRRPGGGAAADRAVVPPQAQRVSAELQVPLGPGCHWPLARRPAGGRVRP